MNPDEVLVQIITGNRPKLKERPTSRTFVPHLLAAGFENVEWVIREDHAPAYELDDLPLNVYSREFAYNFARSHWRHPTVRWERDGFIGAFSGREWAMREARRRGFKTVLQLDDNIEHAGPINSSLTKPLDLAGQMTATAVKIAESTNLHMLGFQLNSVPPKTSEKVVRVGFPYSVFLEKTDRRMPYYGPFEDDVMHAFEYGLNGGPERTAGIIPLFRYQKLSSGSSGMRAHYTGVRGLELPRRYPNNAKLKVSRATSSPNDRTGLTKVRHFLSPKGFTPIKILDAELYAEASAEVAEMTRAGMKRIEGLNARKIRERAGR